MAQWVRTFAAVSPGPNMVKNHFWQVVLELHTNAMARARARAHTQQISKYNYKIVMRSARPGSL